jgi:tetratricopeptide (TPR) repeat protein
MAENIIRLRIENSDYEAKLKRAVSGLQSYEAGCRKVGGTLEVVEKETLDYVKALGKMETVSRSTKGRVGELSNAFVELKSQYNRLTQAEKQSPYGKELAKSLEQLKARIHESKQELAGINKEMNGGGVGGGIGNVFNGLSIEGANLTNILGQVGGSLGMNTSLITGLSAGTLGLAGAIAAASAAAAKGAQEFKAYNDELARQSQVTSVTTGLQGSAAEKMTAEARAISEVYGTDFREVINAANTLMTQFGKSGDDAIQLIRDGMQGMIMGDGGKLLSMIQQYAPAFRDAGISADQLVAVIHNSEGGIFTDENMNAIVMGIKNIRLMTKATSDALQQLGIDGQQMTRDLDNGTITIFEALQKVAGAIENVDSNSQAAGQVMLQVFGRQGVKTGTNIGKAIRELNLNLEETKRQTGQVGESFAKLERAQEDLEKAMQKAFGIEGWDKLTNTIEYGVTEAMTGLLSIVGGLYDGIHEIGNALGGPVTEFALRAAVALANPLMMVREILNGLGMLESDKGSGKPTSAEMDTKSENMAHGLVYKINSSKNPLSDYSRIMAKLEALLQKYEEASNKYGVEITQRIIDYVDKHTQAKLGGVGVTGTKGKKQEQKLMPTTTPTKTGEADDFQEMQEIIGLLNIYKQKIEDLTRQKSEAWSEDDIAKYNKELQEANKEYQRLLNLGTETTTQLSPLQSMNEALKELRKELEMAPDTNTYKEKLEEIADLERQIKEFKGEPTSPVSTKSGNKNPYMRTREDGKTEVYLDKALGGVASGMNQMVSSMEQLGIDLPDGIQQAIGAVQGISTILTGIATTLLAIEALATADVVLPFPFANGGVVHAAGGFVVPGNYNSGDLVPAALSSGEVVLNRAQQGVIANALQQEQRGGGNGMARVSGEQIWLALNAYTRRTGQGEIVTWK